MIFLISIANTLLERIVPVFRLFQLGLVGVARLKLCFIARTVLISFLFQAIEKRAGALGWCVETLLREFLIERSAAFYGNQITHEFLIHVCSL